MQARLMFVYSEFKLRRKDYIFILLHKGTGELLMLTEHFVYYLPPTRETLSNQNPQEQKLTEFMAWCGKITSAPSTVLIVPSADISDALKVAVFTSSAPSVKKHSQSSHAKMRKTSCNAQKIQLLSNIFI